MMINHVFCRVFHRGVLQVVDKTLGISLSECHCLPNHAPHAMAKSDLMPILLHLTLNTRRNGLRISICVAVNSIQLLHFMLVVTGAALIGTSI